MELPRQEQSSPLQSCRDKNKALLCKAAATRPKPSCKAARTKTNPSYKAATTRTKTSYKAATTRTKLPCDTTRTRKGIHYKAAKIRTKPASIQSCYDKNKARLSAKRNKTRLSSKLLRQEQSPPQCKKEQNPPQCKVATTRTKPAGSVHIGTKPASVQSCYDKNRRSSRTHWPRQELAHSCKAARIKQQQQ